MKYRHCVLHTAHCQVHHYVLAFVKLTVW